MRTVVLTSSALRHRYFLKVVSENSNLVGVIHENKGEYYTKQQEQSKVVKKHFDKLAQTENEFFFNSTQHISLKNIEVKNIDKNEINDPKLVDWIQKLNPDIILLFGTGILKECWLNRFENRIINLHLGLSPFYRGSATLFWPFVNDELECVGATIHIAAKRVDAGDILKRIKPTITPTDNYYSVNYKTIKEAIESIPSVAKNFLENKAELIKQDSSTSKVYKKSDFTEDILTAMLQKYQDSIPLSTIDKIKKSHRCICCQ
jgi:methionyl-tRNA formyltransferase